MPKFSYYKIPCKLAENFSKILKEFVLRELRVASVKLCDEFLNKKTWNSEL